MYNQRKEKIVLVNNNETQNIISEMKISEE